MIHPMPRIRCSNCSQNYDVPPQIAVRLPMSIATCHCGEWLCGSKEQILTRFSAEGNVEEIDLAPYKVDAPLPSVATKSADLPADSDDLPPRSVRVIARGASASIDRVFTIDRQPLWIGRHGCHVELDDAELSIRHCAIRRRRDQLVVFDEDSHTGTFLDGEPVEEAVIGEGSHLLRVGGALICIEPVDAPGTPVEAIELTEEDLLGTSSNLMKKLMQQRAKITEDDSPLGKSVILVCIQGPLEGKEYALGPNGLIVGREGDVRVPDEFLSRKHFTIFFDEEGVVRIRDLGSRNGTFLNTLPAKNTKVHPGDQIKAGVNEFRIEER
jgi:pSer/pThr/pTyr-binding forkhead associated (FHA) protein